MPPERVKRKILLLGDGAVGKTSLIRRFVVDKFSDDYVTTIGAKVTKKDLRLELGGRTIDLTLMIWDVLGQKGFTGIQDSAFGGARGVLFVYDVTREETWRSIQEYWTPRVEAVVGSIPRVVVGNKVDLVPAVADVEGRHLVLSESLTADGFLSSAKTGENVEAAFLAIGERVVAAPEGPKPVSGVRREGGPQTLIEVADRIMSDFCTVMGGLDVGMPIVRQQFSRAGVDLNAPDSKRLEMAIECLAEVEKGFRDEEEVRESRERRMQWLAQAT